MKKFILLVTFFAAFHFNDIYATHIAGGEITYVHAGGDNYNLSMVIYRDDFYGNPGATYDNPAVIVVYDENGNYVNRINASFNSNQVINNIGLGSDEFPACATIPNNIRIQKYTYNFPFTVPNANLGYYFTYARCCRNGDLINNLVNPGDQGGRYVAYIPPTNPNQNSSPTFVNNPKVFFCLNTPLVFDQSAIDPDGDELVYSLCDPYQGLTANNPIITTQDPVPFNFGPPFQLVTWANGFSATQPLGAASNLTIDPQSGILTGTPTQQGTYVVGICVQEYRNGNLLSTTLRDFQYTVIPCDFPTPAAQNLGIFYEDYLIIERNCEDFTIDFVNQSSAPSGINFNDLTFTWEFGDGNSSNDVNPTYTYPDTGVYLVKLKVETPQTGLPNDCGSDSTFYHVLIYPDYTAQFNPIPNNICRGQEVFFENTSFSDYDVPVNWNWNFGGTGTSTQENPTHTFANTGTYNVQLQVTTEKGCIKFANEQVVVNPSPVALFSLTPEICLGEEFTITNNSSISSGNIGTYNWSFGDGNTSSDINPNHDFNTTGNFDVSLLAISDLGCRDSISQSIIVNPLPNITISPDNIICPNTGIQLNATGGEGYVWSPTDLLNNSNISNPFANLELDPTEFTVIVTTNKGCIDSSSVFIDLFPLPAADAGEDTSVCLNVADITVFNTTVPLSASGGISYNWTPTTGLSNPNNANTNASPTENTDYIVEVTDNNGCVAYDTVRVIVLNPDLDIIQVDVDSICFGDTVFVAVLDQGDISSYQWTPTNFVTDPTANAPGFFPPSNTVYNLAITNYCYQKDEDVLIEVLPLPNLDAGPLDSICLGDPPYQLNATPNDLEFYEWTTTDNSLSNPNIPNPTISPTVTSDYFLFAIDSIGTLACENRDSTTIIVYNIPEIEIALPNDYPGWICLGDNIELGIITNDGIEFDWTSNDVNNTFNNNTLQNTIATPIDTTHFFATTTNIHGCVNSDSVTIDVQLPISPFIAGDTAMCFGESVELLAGGGLYYDWSPETFFENPNNPFTTAFPDSSQFLFVNISNDCFDADTSIFITVFPLPEVNAGPSIEIFRDEYGILQGSGSGNPLWLNVEGNEDGIYASNGYFDPVVSPFNTADFILTTTDPITGCQNFDTTTVFVEILTYLAFPTGFSPNGDGVNDFARIIKYLNIDQLVDLSIYNRWGGLVFRTTDINQGWDGTYRGKDAEIGVYVWVIRAITKDQEEILRKGNITLIR